MEIKAIDQAEIDEIIKKYEKQMELVPENQMAAKLAMQNEIAKTIARQRKEAIEAGGELGARVQRENDINMQEIALGITGGPAEGDASLELACDVLAGGAGYHVEGRIFYLIHNKNAIANLLKLDVDHAADMETFKRGLRGEAVKAMTDALADLAGKAELVPLIDSFVSEGKIREILTDVEREAVKQLTVLQMETARGMIMSLMNYGTVVKGAFITGLKAANVSTATPAETMNTLLEAIIKAEQDKEDEAAAAKWRAELAKKSAASVEPLIAPAPAPTPAPAPAPAPAAPRHKWICVCGQVNEGRFCPECGKASAAGRWICSCGKENTTKFCPECGEGRE